LQKDRRKQEQALMDKDELKPPDINSEVRKAQLTARRKEEAKEAAEAWAEHVGYDKARDENTARLKAQRLARDAAGPVKSSPPAKTKSKKRR
jgi:hypothetical protein